MTLTSLEICGGAGGQALGLEQAGFEHVAVVDNDPDSCETLRRNRPGWKVVEQDLRGLDGRQFRGVDLLCGGVPCFIAGTMILTAGGYIPIEQVTTDDLVLTHRGVWKRVTRIMTKPHSALWEIQAGQKIVTTPGHPFYVRSQRAQWDNAQQRTTRAIDDPRWVEASNLNRNHRVGHVMPPIEQPSETRGSWWWLAGRYLADGWPARRAKTGAGNPVASEQGRIVIACGPGKEDELRKQLDAAGLRASEVRERAVLKLHIHGQEFYWWCQRFGHGASEKSLPGDALALPPALARHLLEGYLAGDGHLGRGGWEARTASKALALGLVMLAHRARDAAASIMEVKTPDTHVIEGRTVQQRPSWRVTIPLANRSHIIDGNYAWRLVKQSRFMGSIARVYNISVDEDESYIADGVIVHNCQPFSVGGLQLGVADERNLFPEALRLIEEAEPRGVLLENVKGLGGPKFDGFRALIITRLEQQGYQVWWNLELASAHGVPQLRPRMVLIALKWPWATAFRWPADPVTPTTAGLALYDLMKAGRWPGAAHWALERCNAIAPTLVGGSRKHGGPDLGPTRARAAWAKLGVNGGSVAEQAPGAIYPLDHMPRLTPRMMARLQGFPDDWEFAGGKTSVCRQIGNAFPPPVARDLGAAIREALQ